MSEIRCHGTLEICVRNEAERWGYRAELVNRDIDPLEPRPDGTPRDDPGRGDIVMTGPGNQRVTAEYHLPEDEDDIRRLIADIARGGEVEKAEQRRNR